MRQILMTFFGKPRTAAAAHANEHDSIFTWMTIPLMMLAVFAVAVGWSASRRPSRSSAASPPTRSSTTSAGWLKRCTSRWSSSPFNPVPLATSLVVALGGLLLGWLVYRKVRTAGVNLERARF